MKIKFGFVCMFMFAGILFANAQGGMRRTAEERTKRVVDTLASVLKLDQEHQAQVNTIYLDYNKAWDKLREGGRPDQSAMQKIIEDRDEKLKKVLTADQFKKLKDEIEPAMRPRRQGGGGNGR